MNEMMLEESSSPSITGTLSGRGHKSAKHALLAGHPLFSTLDRADIEKLVDYARIESFTKGASIFQANDPGHGLLAVVRGAVKIGVQGEDGKETVFNIIHPGEVFGEIALLDGRPRTTNATALAECDLLALDRRDFIPFLRLNPEIGLTLLSVLCDRLRRTSDQVEDVLFLDVAGRLAKTVLRLSASDQNGNRRVRATQKEMGQMIGLSRESTNKQLQAWVRSKWITIEKGGIIVKNAAALERFAMENL